MVKTTTTTCFKKDFEFIGWKKMEIREKLGFGTVDF